MPGKPQSKTIDADIVRWNCRQAFKIQSHQLKFFPLGEEKTNRQIEIERNFLRCPNDLELQASAEKVIFDFMKLKT